MNRRVLALCGFLLSCGSEAPPPSDASALPPGVVARAGAELIASSTLARIAERQSVPGPVAAQLAVSDALFAQAARSELPTGTARSVQRAALARALLEVLAKAAAETPPTDAELREIAKERWPDVARPDAARVTHVVVLNDKPEKSAGARALADRLAAAVSVATSAEEFAAIARAFPADGFEVRAEPLPFVTSDGRTFVRTELGFSPQKDELDASFAKAANSLGAVGQLSPVVETRFGFHIIRLEERVPGLTVGQGELAATLGRDVWSRRGAVRRRELLEKLKSSTVIQIERAADELTASVKAAP